MLTTSAFAAGWKPCVVWTMPSPYRRRLRWVIMASTPSRVFTQAWLGVGSFNGNQFIKLTSIKQAVHRIYTLQATGFPVADPIYQVLCSNR